MNKSPAALLNEMVDTNGKYPQYKLLSCNGFGTCCPVFVYSVTLGNVQATGIGNSKKDAMQNAAKLALDQLTAHGNNHQSDDVERLKDFCLKNNISHPVFKVVGNLTMKEVRYFIMECRIGQIIINCTQITKKLAKEISAKKMLNRLLHMSQEELQKVKTNSLPLTNNDVGEYHEDTAAEGNTFGSATIAAFSAFVKEKMREKNISYEELWKDVGRYSYQNVQKLLKKLGLKYFLNIVHCGRRGVICFNYFQYKPDFIITEVNESTERAIKMSLVYVMEFLNMVSRE